MRVKNAPKKTAKDWHKADIKAALEKKGWSFSQLSIHHGLKPQTLRNVLHRSCPKYERIVAEVIGVPAEEIWGARHAERNFKKKA